MISLERCSLTAAILLLVLWNIQVSKGARQASLQEHWHCSQAAVSFCLPLQHQVSSLRLAAGDMKHQVEPRLASAACLSTDTSLDAVCLRAYTLALPPLCWQQEPSRCNPALPMPPPVLCQATLHCPVGPEVLGMMLVCRAVHSIKPGSGLLAG